MKVDYISDTFKGVNYKENKDSCVILKHKDDFLFFLFDGVSSAKNAKIGVDNSIDYIKNNYKNYYLNNNFQLKKLMFDVNKQLAQDKRSELYTTYVALHIGANSKNSKFSSLGDSRLYGISNQYLNQYSKDDKGAISHTITKCLGMKDLNENDFNEIIIQKLENKFLLCSDGFYSFLEKDKLDFFKIFNFSYLANIKKRIKNELYAKNSDDATYILIKIYV